MTRMTDAYAAGLVDGEGCIGIAPSGKAYTARVDVGMTKKASALLYDLQTEYGGTVRFARAATKEWEEALTWTLCGQAAANFLDRILPHLRLKPEQARIALLVQQIRSEQPQTPTGRARWTETGIKRCSVLKTRIHELNRKGPTPAVGPERPIARLVAGQWVTDQTDLLSDLGFQQFSGTLPPSGSMRTGLLYERPTSAPPTNAHACSSSPGLPGALLKTPTAQLAVNGGSQHPDKRKAGGHGPTLADEVEHLLPTPTASLGEDPGQRRPGDLNLRTWARGTALLPTPTAMDSKASGGGSPVERDPHGRGGQDQSWGAYEPAVRRWERVLGRPAPAPTELSTKGTPVLSARFVEWMMGLPDGHVTDLTGRGNALRLLGNGVVPRQAAHAVSLLVSRAVYSRSAATFPREEEK